MSTRRMIFISLLSAIVGGLVVGSLFVFFAARTQIFQTSKDDAFGAGAGYKMLAEFQCRYGETKHILMNGVDDNFALGNPEPGRVSERLSHMPGHPANNPSKRTYDETGRDKNLVDYFDVPPKVTRGLFVTRILPQKDFGNDYIALGDFAIQAKGYAYINNTAFNSTLNELPSHDGWTREPQGLHSAHLKDIVFRFNNPPDIAFFREHEGLLSYLQSQSADTVIDVMIADDTAVDFTGLAVCTEPLEPLGVTLAEYDAIQDYLPNYQILACNSDLTSPACNPIYGDTLCSKALPLACFKDGGLPVPQLSEDVPQAIKEDVYEFWAGGEIEFTQAVKGHNLKTLDAANRFCASQFGVGWRVLDFHDGGAKNVISPRSSTMPESRVWIDIKDQPKGTCWAR